MRKYLMLLLACVVYTVCSGKALIAKQIVVNKNGKGDMLLCRRQSIR